MIKKQSKTKRFFKRIEGFFASFKQRYIINYLLTKAGGKELIARYARRTNDDCRPLGADAPIWVCWWQGADARHCQSVLQLDKDARRHASGNSDNGRKL